MPDKIKILYDAVSKDYNLGSLSEFEFKLQDDTKRKAFYDAVSNEYNLGDFKTFSSKVKKKGDTIPNSKSGSQISGIGLERFQTPKTTETPSVLTQTGKVGYEQETQKKAQQKQKLSEQLNIAKSAFLANQGEDVVRDIEMYQADPDAFRDVETNTSIGNAIRLGLLQGELANTLPVESAPTPEDLQKVADINYKMSRIPQSEASKVWESEGFGIFKNPLLGAEFVTETIASSLAGLYEAGKRTVPTAVGVGAGGGALVGGIGALAGAGIGAMSGMSVAGLNMSTSGEIINALRDNGVDITNRDALVKAFEDEGKMAKIRSTALKYGVPIMAFDVATAGIAGKLIGGAVGKSLVKRIAAGAGESAIQAAGGMAGELTGQIASGKDISPKDIALEGIASLATDAPDVAIGYLGRDKSASSNKNIATQISNLGPELGAEDAKVNLDRDLSNGVITPEEHEDGVNFIQKAVIANEKVPNNVFGENREVTVQFVAKKDDLLFEINQLEEEKAKTDDAFHPAIDEEIKSIKLQIDDINKKIQKESTKPQKQDAIPQQTAGQVPVQPETRISEEVVQGAPESETEIATEEGKEEIEVKLPEINDDDLTNVIEDFTEASDTRLKSKKQKIIDSIDMSKPEAKIAKVINDNFVDIKKQLKESGVLETTCK